MVAALIISLSAGFLFFLLFVMFAIIGWNDAVDFCAKSMALCFVVVGALFFIALVYAVLTNKF